MSQIVWYPPLPSGSGGLDPANLEWGEITGTLSNQTDLQTQLDGKASTSHNHTLTSLSEKSYNSLTDKPDLTSLHTHLNKTDLDNYSPSLFANTSHTHAISDITSLQTTLDAKSPLASPTFTGTVTLPSTTSIGTVSNTELGYLDGVTSAIQTQLDGKHKLFNFTTGTSLTIDGATYNFHTLSVSANSSFSLSNLTTGLLYEFLVKNTGAGSITITIPNTSDVRVADTVDIATGKAREFSLLWDGTKRYWQVSEELTGA